MVNVDAGAANKTRFTAWVSTIVVSLFFCYEFIQLSLFNAISVPLMHDFSLNAAQVGQLSAAYFYANAILLLPAGIMLDNFSTKKLVFGNTALCSLATWAFAATDNYYLALIARFVIGLGGAFCFISCIRIASRWFPPQGMALATGVITTIGMLGGMLTQMPLTLLTEYVGWRHAVFIDAGIGILIMGAIVVFVQDQPADAKIISKPATKVWDMFLLVAQNKQNWIGGIYAALLNFPVVILGALWGINYLTTVHNLTRLEASYATMIYFFGMIIGAPLYGWWSDFIGCRRVPMIIGAFLSLLVILILMLNVHLSLSMIIILFLSLGISISAQILIYPTIAELNSLNLTASATSIVSLVLVSGAFIVQPLFGWLMQRYWQQQYINNLPIYSAENFNYAMWLIPCSCFLAVIIAFFIKETHCCPQYPTE